MEIYWSDFQEINATNIIFVIEAVNMNGKVNKNLKNFMKMENINTIQNIFEKLTPECIQEMQRIHFCADLHAGHPKIVGICNRPLQLEQKMVDEIKEKHKDDPEWVMIQDPEWKQLMNPIHDEWLIKEVFNKYVQKKDEVYILGDVSLAKRNEAEKFVARLNGNKHLITGNHDKNVSHLGNWIEVRDIKDFTFSRKNINIHIVLCHYPMASWNRKIHGSWHLYGHVHGRFQNSGLSWDIGIDNKEQLGGVFGWCRPVNLYEVCLIMNEIQHVGRSKDNTESSVELE